MYVCMSVCVCIYVCMSVHYRYGPPPLQLVLSFHSTSWMQRTVHRPSPQAKRMPRRSRGQAAPTAAPAAAAPSPPQQPTPERKKGIAAAQVASLPPQSPRSPGKKRDQRTSALPPHPHSHRKKRQRKQPRPRGPHPRKKKGKKEAAPTAATKAARVALRSDKKGTEHRGGTGSTGCTCACD